VDEQNETFKDDFKVKFPESLKILWKERGTSKRLVFEVKRAKDRNND